MNRCTPSPDSSHDRTRAEAVTRPPTPEPSCALIVTSPMERRMTDGRIPKAATRAARKHIQLVANVALLRWGADSNVR